MEGVVEKQIVAVRVHLDGGEILYFPYYSDGTEGQPDPGLKFLADKSGYQVGGLYGDYTAIIVSEETHTPWGVSTYPALSVQPYTEADYAVQRLRSQGCFDYYDSDLIRSILENEGFEYGLTSYTSIQNFHHQFRESAQAAISAIRTRNVMLDRLFDTNGQHFDPTRDPGYRTAALMAESCKQKLADMVDYGQVDPFDWREDY